MFSNKVEVTEFFEYSSKYFYYHGSRYMNIIYLDVIYLCKTWKVFDSVRYSRYFTIQFWIIVLNKDLHISQLLSETKRNCFTASLYINVIEYVTQTILNYLGDDSLLILFRYYLTYSDTIWYYLLLILFLS